MSLANKWMRKNIPSCSNSALADTLGHFLAQSTCTHYSSSSGRLYIFLGSGTLKKGPKCGLQKAGCNPYFGAFFQGDKPTHVFKTKIVVADCTMEDDSSFSLLV
jgi:hypothetical protein